MNITTVKIMEEAKVENKASNYLFVYFDISSQFQEIDSVAEVNASLFLLKGFENMRICLNSYKTLKWISKWAFEDQNKRLFWRYYKLSRYLGSERT